MVARSLRPLDAWAEFLAREIADQVTALEASMLTAADFAPAAATALRRSSRYLGQRATGTTTTSEAAGDIGPACAPETTSPSHAGPRSCLPLPEPS